MLLSRTVCAAQDIQLGPESSTLKFMNCEFQLFPVPRRLNLCPHLPGLDQTTPSRYHTKSEVASHRLRSLSQQVDRRR